MASTSPRDLYNEIANKYHDNRQKASNDVTELPEVLKLIGELRGKDLLDMGCGLGTHAKEFIRRGAHVTGYDASENMLEFTKNECGDEGHFFQATHEDVQFEPGSFDIVNASYTLAYSDQLPLIFSKVYSWLRPHGLFVFSIPHPVWLLSHVENMDFSHTHKVTIHVNSYGIDIYNYYYPLDTYIQLINDHHFKLLNLKETVISRDLTGWPEEKYRNPNALVFKVQK